MLSLWPVYTNAVVLYTASSIVSDSYHGAKGGDITIDAPGQHVIERSSVMILEDGTIEARFNINLPARGRSICGDWAYTILVETLPKLVEQALVLKNLDVGHLWTHIRSVEDQEQLRGLLKSAGLVGFIRDGAILPREVLYVTIYGALANGVGLCSH